MNQYELRNRYGYNPFWDRLIIPEGQLDVNADIERAITDQDTDPEYMNMFFYRWIPTSNNETIIRCLGETLGDAP